MNKILKTNLFQRSVLGLSVAVLAVATVTAPTVQAQSLVNSVRCGTITAYASAATAKLNLKSQAMQRVFELNLQIVQNAWDLQSQATNAIRDTADSGFTNVMNTLKTFVRKENKKDAFDTYKTNILAARTTRNTDVDTAQATYREDMFATIKTHQADLTTAVNTLKSSIGSALDVAKKNCTTNGSVATLVSAIVSSKATLLKVGIAADIKAINKAIDIKKQRFTDVLAANKTYANLALSYTKTLTSALFKK